jgi:hypothetical protein
MPLTPASLDTTNRKLYDEMLERIQILSEVASHYFLSDVNKGIDVAVAVRDSVHEFYVSVVKPVAEDPKLAAANFNNCGSRCWDEKSEECVDCGQLEARKAEMAANLAKGIPIKKR